MVVDCLFSFFLFPPFCLCGVGRAVRREKRKEKKKKKKKNGQKKKRRWTREKKKNLWTLMCTIWLWVVHIRMVILFVYNYTVFSIYCILLFPSQPCGSALSWRQEALTNTVTRHQCVLYAVIRSNLCSHFSSHSPIARTCTVSYKNINVHRVWENLMRMRRP